MYWEVFCLFVFKAWDVTKKVGAEYIHSETFSWVVLSLFRYETWLST